jgi:hypothetical protein
MSSDDLSTVHLDRSVYNREYSDLEPYASETIEFVGGMKLYNVHPFIKCSGRHCTIHNPSKHRLSDKPLHWRGDKGIFERLCDHGIGHDDHDDVVYRVSIDPENGSIGIHGCDGCCAGKYEEAKEGGGWIEGVEMNQANTDEDNGTLRTFESGATRDTAKNKNDYEGFLNPLVIRAFGDYMHKHREQSDGRLRPSDNWQKGMSKDAYMKSMWRHLMDVWTIHRGYVAKDFDGNEVDLVEALCALAFNAMGYMFEEIK